MKAELRLQEKVSSNLQRFALASLGSLLILSWTGCTALRPSEQRLVARPNMTFSDSATLVCNSSRLFPQLASGFATAG